MSRQIVQVNPATVNKLLEGLHIASLRPANVGSRIVDPLFLVVGIVPAGSVRARHTQFEFLLVPVRLAIKSCGRHAYHDDSPPLAHQLARQVDRIQTGGARCNNHGVRSQAAG